MIRAYAEEDATTPHQGTVFLRGAPPRGEGFRAPVHVGPTIMMTTYAVPPERRSCA